MRINKQRYNLDDPEHLAAIANRPTGLRRPPIDVSAYESKEKVNIVVNGAGQSVPMPHDGSEVKVVKGP